MTAKHKGLPCCEIEFDRQDGLEKRTNITNSGENFVQYMESKIIFCWNALLSLTVPNTIFCPIYTWKWGPSIFALTQDCFLHILHLRVIELNRRAKVLRRWMQNGHGNALSPMSLETKTNGFPSNQVLILNRSGGGGEHLPFLFLFTTSKSEVGVTVFLTLRDKTFQVVAVFWMK